MSHLAGRWHLRSDGSGARPGPEAGIVDRLRRAARRSRPDGVRTRVAGPVAMVHGARNTRRSERDASQPVHRRVGEGDLLLAWDGHLDHRRRLADDLAAAHPGFRPPPDPDDFPDPVWVLAAYKQWGRALCERLAGEYAFALWDGRSERLLLARDPSDARPLFYRPGTDGVTWASTLDALLAAHPETPRDLDEGWIAGFLTGAYPAGRTPYRALHAVPSAHVVEIVRGADGFRRTVRRFWRPEELPDLRLADDREYEERFRAVFLDAVGEHLRTDGPAFLELSGGVDSSSIACAGDLLLRRGAVEAPELHTVSYVFDTSPLADERRWIREVETRTGRPAHHVVEEEHPLLHRFDAPVRDDIPSVLPIFRARYQRVGERMEAAGARVLLTGIGGDHIGWSEYAYPPQLADLASGWRPVDLLREARRWQPALGAPYLQLLWRAGLRQAIPGLRRSQLALTGHKIEWLADGFGRRAGLLAQAGRTGAEPIPARRPSQRQHYEMIRDAAIGQISSTYPEAAQMGVEMRHPFLDRRLTEFCLSVPVEQFVRPGETRSLHRRALAGLLPESIRTRTSKAGPDQPLMRALAREWPRIAALLGDDALVHQLGIVEPGPFRKALEARRFGHFRETGPVERVLALEVWLRHTWSRPVDLSPAPAQSEEPTARVAASTAR